MVQIMFQLKITRDIAKIEFWTMRDSRQAAADSP